MTKFNLDEFEIFIEEIFNPSSKSMRVFHSKFVEQYDFLLNMDFYKASNEDMQEIVNSLENLVSEKNAEIESHKQEIEKLKTINKSLNNDIKKLIEKTESQKTYSTHIDSIVSHIDEIKSQLLFEKNKYEMEMSHVSTELSDADKYVLMLWKSGTINRWIYYNDPRNYGYGTSDLQLDYIFWVGLVDKFYANGGNFCLKNEEEHIKKILNDQKCYDNRINGKFIQFFAQKRVIPDELIELHSKKFYNVQIAHGGSVGHPGFQYPVNQKCELLNY